jgi:hypothetical protein
MAVAMDVAMIFIIIAIIRIFLIKIYATGITINVVIESTALNQLFETYIIYFITIYQSYILLF